MELNERISALIDDAGDASDHALLQSLNNPELSGAWSRYHLIGDTLRDQNLRPDPRFVAKIAAAIADVRVDTPAPTRTVIPLVPKPRRWLRRPALSAALAASAVFAALGIIASNKAVDSPAVAGVENQRRSLNELTMNPAIPVLSDGEYQRRLNAYLVNFNEQRAQLHAPGVHPYVRVVDFEFSTP